MKPAIKRIVKAILFCCLLLFGIGKLGSFFQPIWLEWSNYDRTNGFYKEPSNTIETVFLGSSVMVNGISPIKLYEDYGICAYNLATEQQPVLSSYYWLKEAYRLHSGALSTVVLDVSMLRRALDNREFYQKALDNLAMSGNKTEAVQAYTNEENEFLNYLFPLNEYHERWSELVSNDFDAPKVWGFLRGYNPSFQFYIDMDDYQNLALPNCYLNEESDMMALDGESLYYLKEIIRFCKENNLKLLIIKTPTLYWEDSAHIAIEALAREYDCEFLDYNYEPLVSEIGFDFSTGLADNHMNYYGACTLTQAIGKYLIEQCGNHDVRNNSRYAFLDDELEMYQSFVEFKDSLCDKTDICGYLQEALAQRGCTVFLSVMDDAASALLDEQRAMLSSFDLNLLSQIAFHSSYLAVIEDGNVQTEMTDENEGSAECIQFSGRTKDNKIYNIHSGGLGHGNLSSILIDGQEYSLCQRGINVVIYDYINRRVIDSSTFDTCLSSTQEPFNPKSVLRLAEDHALPYDELPERAKKAWMYNRRYANSKYEYWWYLFCSKDQVFEYLSPYIRNKDYTVYIAVQDEAANSFDDEARSEFRELGLTELARLEFRDSYIGIIDDGRVRFEQRDHGDAPITYERVDCRVVSGGCDSGNCSAIFIDDEDHATHSRGLNIVVYDKALQTVVSQYAFDTCEIPINLSDFQEKRGNVA